MTLSEARLRYMRAHIRLNSRRDPVRWDAERIVESFYILPLPEVDLLAWCEIMGYEIEDDDAARNDHGLAAILADGIAVRGEVDNG